MKWEDLDVAIQFFEALGEDIIIQVPTIKDVTPVRRHILRNYGEADAVHVDKLKYNGKYIRIIPLNGDPSQFLGCPERRLFYVGWVSGNEPLKFDE